MILVKIKLPGQRYSNFFFADEELGKNARIKGNALISENNLTKIKKGIFTTCEEREDNCPPWSISASEIVHDKKIKQLIIWILG